MIGSGLEVFSVRISGREVRERGGGSFVFEGGERGFCWRCRF